MHVYATGRTHEKPSYIEKCFISPKTEDMKETRISGADKREIYFGQIPPTSTSNSKTSKSSLIPGKLNCGVLSVGASRLYLNVTAFEARRFAKGTFAAAGTI